MSLESGQKVMTMWNREIVLNHTVQNCKDESLSGALTNYRTDPQPPDPLDFHYPR